MYYDESEQVERTNKLCELIKQLVNPTYSYDGQKGDLIEQLTQIYAPIGHERRFRHRYSEISRILYDLSDDAPDAAEMIGGTLACVIPDIEDDEIRKAVQKLADHIDLEGLRIGQMQNVLGHDKLLGETYEQAKKTMDGIVYLEDHYKKLSDDLTKNKADQDKLAERISKEQEKVEKVESEIREHNAQTVAVLSIFAGVVFAFTGGFSMLGNVFSSVANLNKSQAMVFMASMILMGMMLVDIIYMMMRFVQRFVIREKAKTSWFFMVANVLGLIISGFFLWRYWH